MFGGKKRIEKEGGREGGRDRNQWKQRTREENRGKVTYTVPAERNNGKFFSSHPRDKVHRMKVSSYIC